MIKTIIPMLRVTDSIKSEALFKRMGFKVIWEHQEGEGGPRFLEMGRDKVSCFLSEHGGDGPTGIYLYFLVEDAPKLHDEFVQNEVPISGELHRTEWDHDKFEIVDLDGNTLSFGSAATD